MGRIVIVPADQSREYIHPIPDDHYGMHKFRYAGAGNYVMPLREPQSLDPALVQSVVEELQDVIPLGDLAGPEGDYFVFLVDGQLLAGPDPTNSFIDGERHEGWIILSGMVPNVREVVADLFGHEVAHELDRSEIDPVEKAEFFALIKQEPGSETGPIWEQRPQERMAEYLSTALWSLPIDRRMPVLDPAVLAKVREFALSQFSGAKRAEVVIAGEEQPYIVLTINSPKALVGGQEVPIDPANPAVTPIIMHDRTMVPLRFVAENMGLRVQWDEATRQVRIYRPNGKPLPK